MREAILEPMLRRARIRQVLPVIAQYPGCTLLDIGCGWEAKFLRTIEPWIAHGEGLDFKAPDIRTAKVRTQTMRLMDCLPFPDGSFDVVTMLAVLEHLSNPGAMLVEIRRVLRPGGRLVLTAPSNASKPLLEFVAFRLGIVSEAEIRDHKRYYNRSTLSAAVVDAGMQVEVHRYFQLGMNNFLIGRKRNDDVEDSRCV